MAENCSYIANVIITRGSFFNHTGSGHTPPRFTSFGRQVRWRVICADSCSVYFSSCDNPSVNSHEMWSDRDQTGVSLNSSQQQHIMIFMVHELSLLSLLMITPLDFVTV